MSSRPPSQLRTDWDTDDASVIIDFLTQMRDEIWTLYGDRIIAKRWEETCQHEGQESFDWDDDETPF